MNYSIPVGQLATLEQAQQLGLRPEEFEKIKEILGRTPTFTEMSIYSVMWSEHCSYKNSIVWLKTLPKEGEKMLAKAGEENAGLIDIGDGLACCFKIESHNHPSAIEPYQGAATGVGGINRDIFSMGARPIAQLNSLRFGNIDNERTKWLVRGVVKGIGNYGNAFGIPTVGGEVYFDDCYQINPLVNAMSVGIAKVVKEFYQDPTTDDKNWVVVDLSPFKKLKKTVTLEQIKADEKLQNIGLVKQGRLSVMEITQEEFDYILLLAK